MRTVVVPPAAPFFASHHSHSKNILGRDSYFYKNGSPKMRTCWTVAMLLLPDIAFRPGSRSCTVPSTLPSLNFREGKQEMIEAVDG